MTCLRVYGQLSLQGAPTTGLRKFGVPPGGALDRESLRLANTLVGNPEWQPAWELLGSGEFVLECEGSVAVVGGNGAVNGEPSNFVRRVRSGERLSILQGTVGACLYIAFGDGPSRRLAEPPTSLDGSPLRIIAGPQANTSVLERLTSIVHPVSIAKDRVGTRLDSRLPEHETEIPSEPACVGAVQVTSSGVPIILGPDGPTLGGYPKVAVVVDADMDRVGQLTAGQKVRFEEVGFEQAEEARRTKEKLLQRRLQELRVFV